MGCVSTLYLPCGDICGESVAKMRHREAHRFLHVTLQEEFVHAPGGNSGFRDPWCRDMPRTLPLGDGGEKGSVWGQGALVDSEGARRGKEFGVFGFWLRV